MIFLTGETQQEETLIAENMEEINQEETPIAENKEEINQDEIPAAENPVENVASTKFLEVMMPSMKY